MPYAATRKSTRSEGVDPRDEIHSQASGQASAPVSSSEVNPRVNPGASWSRTLIVTPTYNEKDSLPRFIGEVRNAVPDAHILVVDDNSPDGTGAVADEIAAKDDHVRVLHRAGKLGLGTAYTQAFAKGLTEGYD